MKKAIPEIKEFVINASKTNATQGRKMVKCSLNLFYIQSICDELMKAFKCTQCAQKKVCP